MHAASPVTHVVIADNWMETVRPFHGKHRDAFISGNLFPDIRYLGEVSRDSTHEADVTLEDVLQSPSPFLAGTRLHSWLDETREALVVKWGIYSHVEKYAEGHMTTLLKMVEDEILFHRLSPPRMMWNILHISEEERETGISKSSLAKWHWFLSMYFSCRPSTQMKILANRNTAYLNIPAATVKKWSKVIPYLAQKQELLDYVEALESAVAEQFTAFREDVSELRAHE